MKNGKKNMKLYKFGNNLNYIQFLFIYIIN